MEGKAFIQDLPITKQLSMNPSDYIHNVFQAIAAMQLLREGIEISAGQTIRYLITDAQNRRIDRRVKAAELVGDDTRYDAKKYLEMLLSSTANILSPFGYTVDKLHGLVIYGEKQTPLN